MLDHYDTAVIDVHDFQFGPVNVAHAGTANSGVKFECEHACFPHAEYERLCAAAT